MLSQQEVPMSVNSARELVRKFYSEIFSDLSRVDLSNVGRFISSYYIDHNNDKAGSGVDLFRAHINGLRHTFPDFTLSIADIMAEGDKVVTRVTGRGTHTGVWMQIEPTGAVINVKGINIDRVEEGRIVEHWGEADTISMLFQMGIDPFTGKKAERA